MLSGMSASVIFDVRLNFTTNSNAQNAEAPSPISNDAIHEEVSGADKCLSAIEGNNMPELPDVETFKRVLEKNGLRKTIGK